MTVVSVLSLRTHNSMAAGASRNDEDALAERLSTLGTAEGGTNDHEAGPSSMNAEEPASASVQFDVSDPEVFGMHLSAWATSTQQRFDRLERQLGEVLTVVLEGQRGQQSHADLLTDARLAQILQDEGRMTPRNPVSVPVPDPDARARLVQDQAAAVSAEDRPAAVSVEDRPAEDRPAEDRPAEDRPAEDRPAEGAFPARAEVHPVAARSQPVPEPAASAQEAREHTDGRGTHESGAPCQDGHLTPSESEGHQAVLSDGAMARLVNKPPLYEGTGEAELHVRDWLDLMLAWMLCIGVAPYRYSVTAALLLRGQALQAWIVFCKSKYGVQNMAQATWEGFEECLLSAFGFDGIALEARQAATGSLHQGVQAAFESRHRADAPV